MNKKKFKSIWLLLTVFTVFAVLLYTCKKDEPEPEPVANFTANTTSITEGETVNFTDLSTNTPTSWSWNFGDGGTSTSKNPSNTYSTSGTYTVSLTATNFYGSDTETKTDYIYINVTFSIGDSYQGGIIAYILQSGDPGYVAGQLHGIIAAASDQSTGIQWYNGSYVTTGATATALGTGNANTNTIVSIQGAGSYAAKLCYDLVLGGYSDWYLPSKDELNKLYLNKAAIGGFTSSTYWSSTEAGANNAWIQYFSNGYQYGPNKDNTDYVRAVRAF